MVDEGRSWNEKAGENGEEGKRGRVTTRAFFGKQARVDMYIVHDGSSTSDDGGLYCCKLVSRIIALKYSALLL